MILLITSTHTVQVTQNVTSTANFNLMPNTDGESTEHRDTRLEASCTETVEAGVWMDGGEQGWALVVMVVAFSSRTRILGEDFFYESIPVCAFLLSGDQLMHTNPTL